MNGRKHLSKSKKGEWGAGVTAAKRNLSGVRLQRHPQIRGHSEIPRTQLRPREEVWNNRLTENMRQGTQHLRR